MHPNAEQPFRERIRELPRLGLGISTEFGAGASGLDVVALGDRRPDLVGFLEIGVDLERGIDADAERWIGRGRPVTYHFLDVNLEEPEDVDDAWVRDTRELARRTGAAWICGDAGLWHVGPREHGHGLLLPPILVRESAEVMAEAVRGLRRRLGFEILPENPPAHAYVGDMHILEYFGHMASLADSGLLLDVAHLVIHQRAMGKSPMTGLEAFDLSRVVEVHIAGGTPFEHDGRTFLDDDHGPDVLAETWEVFERIAQGAVNLKATVVECERNQVETVLPIFERAHDILERAGRL